MAQDNAIRKINTTDGTITGNSYLTNANTITVNNETFNIVDGFDFSQVSSEVQEAAKYKKSFNINDSIPVVELSNSIELLEAYDKPKKYASSSHSYKANTGETRNLNIPKRLDGWQYRANGAMADIPSYLNDTFAQNFENGNLNAYAKWVNDVKCIRVAVVQDFNVPLIPSCSVQINSTSYNGTKPLTINYSKLIHNKQEEGENIEWTTVKNEFGINNTDANSYGNGCRIEVGNDKYLPCYYGIKSGDSITITLSNLVATYNGQTFPNALQPKLINYDYVYKKETKLSAYVDILNDTNINFDIYTSNYGGGYTIQLSNITNDVTLFLPITVITYQITVKSKDSTGTSKSSQGLITVASIMYNESYDDEPQTLTCVNGEKVTLTATPQTGYVFSHWEDGNGDTLSAYNTNTIELTISQSVNGNTYVACFTSGTYQITYHKEAV